MTSRDCLVQAKRTTLKDCLENRVSECVQYPKCKQKRISLCLWDATDELAKTFCNKLSENTDVDFLRLHTKADFTEQFINKLEEYRVKINNREIECPEGIYLLLVYDKSNFGKQFVYEKIVQCVKSLFQTFTMECCRLMDSENMDMAAEDTDAFEWRIHREDIQTAQLLLQTAKYDEVLVSSIIKSDFQDSQCVAVKSTECNAVREDFSQKFLQEVRRQTSKGETQEVELNLQELLYPEKYKRKLKQEIPNPTWLPMVGADELIEILQEEMKQRSFIEKIVCRLKKESFESELTVKETMDVLFGGNDYSTRAERLRKRVKAETMMKICEEIVESNKDDIKETILTGFSLHDIIYTVQNVVLEFRDTSEKHAEKTEGEITKVLANTFYYTDINMETVYSGLKEYLKLYDEFVKNWLEYSWWSALACYLQKLKEEVESEFEALYKAEIVLKNSRIPLLQEKLGFIRENSADGRILTEEELRKKIQTAISNAEFSKTDLTKVIKAIDKYFVTLNEKNVETKRQPKIYMLLSSECALEQADVKALTDKKECAFQWKLIKSKFLPTKITLQLRVYDLNKEE